MSETDGLPKEEKKQKICDAVLDLLIMAYVFGCDRVVEGLPEEQTVLLSQTDFEPEGTNISQQELYEVIYKPIAGETFEQRIRRRIDEETSDEETLNRIMETDYHRVEETGADYTARTIGGHLHLNVYKTWRGMLDERERDQHWLAEGQTVPRDQMFTMPDGSQAMYPGMFGIAEQDCNCRCWAEYTFR
jgi:hypothetical protein